jgi:hypothetical protein
MWTAARDEGRRRSHTVQIDMLVSGLFTGKEHYFNWAGVPRVFRPCRLALQIAGQPCGKSLGFFMVPYACLPTIMLTTKSLTIAEIVLHKARIHIYL